jgi:chromosome segregation ATPase
LEKLIANHADTLSSENRDSIVTVLESCMKGIISGSVSVKETDKSVDQITGLMSVLDDFIARKNETKSQLEDLKKKLEVFNSKQLDDLEKQLARAKSDRDDAESKIKKLQSDIDQDNVQMPKLVGDLQGSLENISGTKYTISL